jgi:hypothetical protein
MATDVTSQLQLTLAELPALFPPDSPPLGRVWTKVPGEVDDRVCGQLLNGRPGFRTCTSTRSL